MRSRGNSSGEEKEPYPKAVLEAADESKKTPRVCFFIGAHRQKLQILTLNRGSSSGLACGAVLLLPAVRRAKNKRCLPGHPDSQSPAGASRCLVHAAPPTPTLHTHRARSSSSSVGTRLPKGGPLSEMELLHFYTLNNYT